MNRYRREHRDETDIYRAKDPTTGAPVLIWQAPKVDDDLARRTDARLATLRDMPGFGLARPLQVTYERDTILLVMEPPAGEPLSRMAVQGRLRVDHFLPLAVRLTEAVQALHARRIAHGHLRPDALFLEPATRTLTLALHPDCLIRPPDRPAGIVGRSLAALAYAAPEQSGRTERSADLRADLYALGVIFHELLSGAPPFQALDEMELIHQHLAVAPRPLCDLRTDLPVQLSDLVAKLLQKAPEARYQSAYGLLSDLRRCAEAQEATGDIPAFGLGALDALATFRIPDRLYGRETQLRELTDTAEAAFAGGLGFVLLAGRSGTGKSAFAARLRDIETGGVRPIFLAGKYEELHSLPYLGVLEALRDFVLDKVAMGGVALDRYRTRLCERLGDNLGILAEFLPELRQVVGDIAGGTPHDPPPDPMERNQRFRLAVQGLFETMAEPGAPVVLFLDDLQWAEGASIALLEDVARTARLSHLMIVGAYRDNVRGASERVGRLVDAFSDAGVATRTIRVRPLGADDTLAMIADTLHLTDASSLRDLARTVHARTQGNAFHLRRLLTALHHEGAIRFDMDAGAWQWQLDAVTRHVVETDVAQLMTERIELLSPRALEAMRQAACFGTTFSPASLRILADRPAAEIAASLAEAEAEGFVERHVSDRDHYSFSHDMVREAAYRLTPAPELAALHHRIGAFLLEDIADPASDDRLFAALDQIGLGIDLLRDPPTGRRLVHGALAAASRAKGLAAYDTALGYLRMAAAVPPALGGVDWETEPETTARLRLETMELTFLVAGFEAAEPVFRELLANLDGPRRKAHVYQVLVTLFTFRSDYARALAHGIEGLKLLGVDLSPPLNPKIGQQLALTHWELRRHDVFDFSALPPMADEASEQLIEMLMIVSTPAFLTNKDLFVLISLRMFRITLRHGLTSAGLFSIQNFAIVLYIAFGAAGRAYRIGTNLFPLLDARGISEQVRGRFHYTYCIVVAWHFRSYGDLYSLLEQGLRHSWRAADLEYVGYFYYGLLKYTWVGCRPLATLVEKLDDYETYQKRLDHEVLNDISAIYRRAVARLTGPSEVLAFTDADRKLGETMRGEAAVGSFLTTQMLLTHVHADWPVVRELYERLLAEEGFTRLGPEFVDYHLLSGLCMTRPPEGALGLAPRSRRARLRRHVAALRRLEEKSPINHGFQHRLLLAEIARHAGQSAEAQARFAEAVGRAEAQGIWSYAGIGAECAARAADEAGDPATAADWRRRARAAYAAWGATAKTAALELAYPDLAPPKPQVEAARPADGLDLATIVKTSQAILEITDVDTLLRRLLGIAMENAGADLGRLYLHRDDGFALAAEADVAQGVLRIRLTDPQRPVVTLPPEAYPREIVARVAASREAMIRTDASAAPDLVRDAYVAATNARSLLVMPIVGSGRLQGVLHLENTLAPGIFTPERQDLLSTIMALAAISLTNALLYARQEAALAVETRAAQELARVNRLKDEFLANTGHELRTPLNGIIGLADSMIAGATGPLPDRTRATLGLIVSSGKRLANLVNDILDFSRLKDGEIEITPVPVDLRAAVDLVFALMEHRARAAGMRLVNDVPEGAGVMADEDRLQQILFNLLDNAVKYAPNGKARVGLAVVDGRARVTVADDGPGIPPSAREDIFRGFEQLDASVQRQQGGLGLGLAITRRLVALHGGQITVETGTPGARFTFDLAACAAPARRAAPSGLRDVARPANAAFPAAPAPDGITLRPAAAASGAPAFTALLVDDDPVNLQVLQNYMALEGFRVASAQDGETALALVAGGLEPDIVLLDVMMPRMSGYTVCARLRETLPAARLPIVMLTAKNRVEDLLAGFEAGATDYLAKPFSREELSARMRAHLALSRVSSAYERFVPVEFLDFLARESILDVDLGDSAARRMTVMFADIRNFTSIAEGLSPAGTFDFLNGYFGRMGPIVQENGGIVTQYLGDGMMALFPGHPREAAAAAIGMQRELRRLNVDRSAKGLSPIGTGIGLHVGDLIVGILGDRYRLNGNVVSDTVNIAARLESLTAQAGISIAASDRVVDALSDEVQAQCRRLTRVRMVGKQQAIDVYEIFAGDTASTIRMKQDSRRAFESAGAQFLRGRFGAAEAAFDALRQTHPGDHAAAWMAKRSRQLSLSDAVGDWDGVDTLFIK